jgi:hypothetical protein
MFRHTKVLSRDGAIARSLRIAGISSVLVISLVRCSYDWDVPSTSSALDVGDASTSSSEAGDDAASDGNASRDAKSGDAESTADADAESTADADASLPIVPLDASCSPSVRCASGSYCLYADQACGTGDKTGTCVSNQGCSVTSPGATSVCSCSGAVYPSACAARNDGQDISASATCSAPANNFQCGYAFCSTADFCVAKDPTDGGANSYSCESMNGCILGCSCAAPAAATTACGGTCAGALLNLAYTEVTCH